MNSITQFLTPQVIIGALALAIGLFGSKENMAKLWSGGGSLISKLLGGLGGGTAPNGPAVPSNVDESSGGVRTLQDVHRYVSDLIAYFKGDENGVRFSAAVGEYAYTKQIREAVPPVVANEKKTEPVPAA